MQDVPVGPPRPLLRHADFPLMCFLWTTYPRQDKGRLRLEDELHAVLNLSRTFGEGGEARAGLNDFSTNDVVSLTAGRVGTNGIGRAAVHIGIESRGGVGAKIRMVKEIEEVEAELQTQFLSP